MFLASLKTRHLQPEIMDEADLEPARHRTALAGLARINFLSASARLYWPALSALARRTPNMTVRVLDIATGGGDNLLGLWRRAQRVGIPMQFEGCDISPVALSLARQSAERQRADIRFFPWDALAAPLPDTYDAVICSLFLHHLGEDQALTLLGHMRQVTRHLVLVNDLVRSREGWLLAWIGSRFLSRSDVVHIDALRSVEGSFTPAEAVALAERAGLHGAKIRRYWPCRYLLSWSRP